ncbi:hypothetical protein PanWU01x14_174070 [Parasponia andersonii]|uniref:Uncharacterized protein n=1 Tax=Parasponia andersonii TaxID=3476 RepID=A0A2P5C928_PARAD|nr:hypothetical protein PanWU01x14_174070 [Parasponia andersonii]
MGGLARICGHNIFTPNSPNRTRQSLSTNHSFVDQKLAVVGSVMETNARFDAMYGQKSQSPLFVLFVIMGFNILPLPD